MGKMYDAVSARSSDVRYSEPWAEFATHIAACPLHVLESGDALDAVIFVIASPSSSAQLTSLRSPEDPPWSRYQGVVSVDSAFQPADES